MNNLIENTTILDCMLEVKELRKECTKFDDEMLINFILQFIGSGIDLPKEVDKSLNYYFESGVLTPDQRMDIENCCILLQNDLCWGEPQEGQAGVFHTRIQGT